MRTLSFLLPSVLGVLVVLQAGVNRSEALRIGFSSAILINACITGIIALLFYFFSEKPVDPGGFSWWFLLPGIFGFCIIWGGAFSVARWGAQHTFILIVSMQLVTSTLWDYFVQKTPPSPAKLLGIVLVGAGVYLALKPHGE